MTTLLRSLAVCAAALLSTAALAQHRGDVILTVENNRISTGLLDPNGVLTPNLRAFYMTLGAASPNFTDSPGMDNNPGTFPYPSTNGFRIRKALRVWNGSKFVHIPGPDPERMNISFATLGPVASPLCDSVVQGFTLQVGSNGQWHRHYEYTLADPGTPGVYLLEMEVYSSVPSIAASRPFWFVILQPAIPGSPDASESAAQADALQWVLTHRVSQACPADFSGDGTLSVQDIFDFLGDWFAGDLDADFDASCQITVQDIFSFLSAWFAGC